MLCYFIVRSNRKACGQQVAQQDRRESIVIQDHTVSDVTYRRQFGPIEEQATIRTMFEKMRETAYLGSSRSRYGWV